MVLAATKSHIACSREFLAHPIGLMTRCKLIAKVTPEATDAPH